MQLRTKTLLFTGVMLGSMAVVLYFTWSTILPSHFPCLDKQDSQAIVRYLVFLFLTAGLAFAGGIWLFLETALAGTINKTLEVLEHSPHELYHSQECKQVEAEFHTATSRLLTLVENWQAGILVEDESMRIDLVNQTFCTMFGISALPQDLVGADCSTLTEQIKALLAVPEVFVERVGRILQEKRIVTNEELWLADGRTFERDYIPIFVNLDYRGHLWQYRDITKRKQTEEALRQAEEKYRKIFENASEGIYQTTPDGRYLSANPALARLYGYSSPEEMIAQIQNIAVQVYASPKRREQFMAAIAKHNAVSKFRSQVYRKDGSIIWISENARAVRDGSGKLLYYEGTIEDITKRKVAEEALRYQQEQSELLLLNILPGPIAARLKLQESIIADSFDEVTVLFADIVNFTELSADIPAAELVKLLNEIFSAFDELADRHGLEKIKTIGDAYMVVGGLPLPRSDHAEAIAQMALDMQQAICRFQTKDGKPFSIRIGINSGSVVAGVIGIKKFSYDLWGDAVNTASRMESQGIPGCIQVTETTYKLLRDKYVFEERGLIQVKGKGDMMAYLLIGTVG